MPVQRCQKEGTQGWRWGDRGTCYIGPDARKKAEAQGRAIKANEERAMSKRIEGIEIFAVGRWNGMEFSTEDLNLIAVAFNQLGDQHQVPLKFGHNEEQPLTDGQPAIGRVVNVFVQGDKLHADLDNVPDIVFDAIQAKLYDKVSIELDMGVQHKDSFFPLVLSGVALLGADIPAVNTLSDLSAFMTRGEDFKAKQHAVFSRTVTKQEETTMPKTLEELQAENAALKAANTAKDESISKLTEDTVKFSTENAQLKTDAEKREADEKALAFKAAKKSLTDDLDGLVKDKIIIPAQRDKMLGEFTEDDAVIKQLRYAVDTLKLGAPGSKLPGKGGAVDNNDDDDDKGLNPSQIVAQRTSEYMRQHGEKNFSVARDIVMRADPDLARQYVDGNGTKGGS